MAEVSTARPTRAVPQGTGRFAMRALAVLYVGVIVLVPVGVLTYRAFEPGIGTFFDAITSPAAVDAFERTALIAVVAVALNVLFGVTVALLMARYRFPGKRLLDALVDLPIAVSPIVVGLALVLVFGTNGWFATASEPALDPIPIMIVATVFVSLPLVLRAVLPVLLEAGTEQEQAAASLGAGWFVTFRRITLPTIRTALGYGIVLALARCIGEFGAVLVVSGGFQSNQTAPIYISNLIQVDFNLDQAFAIAFVLMLVSIAAIVAVAVIQGRKKTP